jgi:hypothetical protein
MKEKFFILFDDASHSVRVEGGVVLAEFSDRASAFQCAKMRGLKLSRQPDPPIAASDTAG